MDRVRLKETFQHLTNAASGSEYGIYASLRGLCDSEPMEGLRQYVREVRDNSTEEAQKEAARAALSILMIAKEAGVS